MRADNDNAPQLPLQPGDKIITEWDDSTGVPVKVSRTVVRKGAPPAHSPA